MKSITCERCQASLNLGQKQFSGGNVISCEYCGTTHVIQQSDGISRDYAKLPGQFDVFLYKLMGEHFSIEEVKMICTDMVGLTGKLSYSYDDIEGEARIGKCRELVKKCRRMGHTNELVNACSEHNRQFAITVDSYTG